MTPLWDRRSPGWLILVLLVGVGLGALVPRAPLHAVATDHTDNFAIATGPVDDELEALFLLDFLTGSLKCAVLSTSTGKFNSAFETSVMDDLGLKANQNPKFMMVTGAAGLRRQGGQMQPGNAVVYVADTSSGRVVAYAVPWTRGLATSVMPFKGQLFRLDVLQFRTQAVRSQ
ncbi:MAG TPA: hypothetical protein VGN12_00780 [Pirellulales bacterium]|jgi:hypothetical protein